MKNVETEQIEGMESTQPIQTNWEEIFLNANGTMDDVSSELKAFLDYVAGKKPEDSYVEKLEEAINFIQNIRLSNSENVTGRAFKGVLPCLYFAIFEHFSVIVSHITSEDEKEHT